MKKLVIFAMMAVVFSLAFATVVQAATLDIGSGFISNDIALGNKDPRSMVAKIINVLLGFLGVIAIIIILLGGFKWMTAAGNEDKIAESKKLMAAGIIGLIIILSAWGITKFVLENLIQATQ